MKTHMILSFTDKSSMGSSSRILHSPSSFASSSLFHLQETGTLQALRPHSSRRENLSSYLFFVVNSGSGILTYGGHTFEIHQMDAVFIRCDAPYSHETGNDLWSLSWCHFYGPNMAAVYAKYRERGGKPVLHPKDISRYKNVFS